MAATDVIASANALQTKKKKNYGTRRPSERAMNLIQHHTSTVRLQNYVFDRRVASSSLLSLSLAHNKPGVKIGVYACIATVFFSTKFSQRQYAVLREQRKEQQRIHHFKIEIHFALNQML